MADAEQTNKMMGMPLSQKQTNYVTVSPESGERQCANCQFFEWMQYVGYDTTKVSGCHLIEEWPLPILPTGKCDRWEQVNQATYEPEPLEVVIVDDTTKAVALTPRHIGGLERRARQMAGKMVDGMQIVRTEKGRIGIIYTSNGYRDRDDEAVAQKALARYVDRSWQDGRFVGDNTLLWWHSHELGPVGDVIWADMVEGFLCEVVEERPTPVAKMVWDWWEAEPDPGASHGFYADALRVEPGGSVTYTDIDKKETTVLPRRYAANGLTYSGVMKMSDVKMQYLAQMFKQQGLTVSEDELADLLKSGPKAINDRLAAAGVVPKERKDAATPAEPIKAPDYSALLTNLIEGMGELLSRQDAADGEVKALKDADAAREKARSDQAATLAALVTDVAALKAQMGQSPRRVGQGGGVEVTGSEADALNKQLEQTERDSFWGTEVKKS